MLTTNTQFEHELKRLIDADIDRIKDILANGSGVSNHDAYKQYVGEISALRRVSHSFCEEVNTKMNKRD